MHTRVIVTHYGGPDALRVIEEECPEPRRGEVRVRVLAAGVCMPDVMAREGIHPETPRVPYRELVPVPSGLDTAEAVSLVLNYVTAYQMLHRSAGVEAGQSVLFHGASGGVGTALLHLGRLAGLTMYGTCSPRGAPTVTELGGVPIDYHRPDVVAELRRLEPEGVHAVFDPIGGRHPWHSREALRPGGRVVGYGTTTALRGPGLGSSRSGRRNRLHGIPLYVAYIAGGWLLPGRRRIVPYSIQTLKRLRPALFRQDLAALLELLRRGKIRPLVAHRIPLAEARRAQELLQRGGVAGKIVLVGPALPPAPTAGPAGRPDR